MLESFSLSSLSLVLRSIADRLSNCFELYGFRCLSDRYELLMLLETLRSLGGTALLKEAFRKKPFGKLLDSVFVLRIALEFA
jgi:hypothetical protein